MSKRKFSLMPELQEMQYDMQLLSKVPCSHEENKKYEELLKSGCSLPEGIFRDENWEEGEPMCFYEMYQADDLSIDERREFVFLQKINNLSRVVSYTQKNQIEVLKNIEKMVKFFVILACIVIGLSFFAVLMFISQNW